MYPKVNPVRTARVGALILQTNETIVRLGVLKRSTQGRRVHSCVYLSQPTPLLSRSYLCGGHASHSDSDLAVPSCESIATTREPDTSHQRIHSPIVRRVWQQPRPHKLARPSSKRTCPDEGPSSETGVE